MQKVWGSWFGGAEQNTPDEMEVDAAATVATETDNNELGADMAPSPDALRETQPRPAEKTAGGTPFQSQAAFAAPHGARD